MASAKKRAMHTAAEFIQLQAKAQQLRYQQYGSYILSSLSQSSVHS